jgi:GxxExxY protein
MTTMHENEISEAVIGAAIEVHRQLGPGLLESVYEQALCHELHLHSLRFKRQQGVLISYKGVKLSTELRLDLLVEEKLIVEIKAKEQLSPIDKPQLLTYLRLAGLRLGLIINFHSAVLKNGIVRVANNLTEPLRPTALSAPLR